MNVTCPTCKTVLEWDSSNRWLPFCSERCKMIDLGAWSNEEYRIPAETASPDDLDQGSSEVEEDDDGKRDFL
ncbi:hypothetical protein C8D92_108144 [Tamilnaduibacter salinus]|uniref:DNA gyrase inhibitor YacG n=1 Tax=Tamilnaduibacter salinus TaxID=1484056 RepID=A0A2A2I3W7_9GAMM|nr:DNA gyrase inhibitor YacG [Tamilnaduibacter salinus]PAV26098.1 DNA gyrase inhibitor YacG [Tamilnaduibacter salinus]PVY70788.1 hypothetical protein C8D92_108144 [Tamilnaduibacter salinus]